MAELLAADAFAALVEVCGKRCNTYGTVSRALQIGLEHIADEINGFGIVFELRAILAARLGHCVGAET
ncbi:hypothetical protein [Sphingobium vermicomposti]|uniref:hypothetical protein n=1 Tax=Sphingobium vermicomposti TaxID=529005 RepID=UPI00141D7A12|nr:hypothetical protein [Sphingobium vermicomposti]